MFDSVLAILSNYIEGLTPFSIYLVETDRGESPDELFYLCNINNKHYVVYETDYANSLSLVIKEIAGKFSSDKVKFLHWLVKKDSYIDVGTMTLPVTIDDKDKKMRKAIIFDSANQLCYAVLEIKLENATIQRYNPTAYGYMENVTETDPK